MIRVALLLALVTSDALASHRCSDVKTPDFRAIWPSGLKGIHRDPTATERDALEKLVREVLVAAVRDAPFPEHLCELARDASFSLERWKCEGGEIWVLREPDDRRRGAGAYLIRPGDTHAGSGPELLLQAPHVYFDLGTDRLSWKLFFDPPAGARRPRALFTNTLHRHRGLPGEKRDDERHPADVAHEKAHLFQLATVTAARALGAVDVVQLHAFGARGEGDDGKDGVDASVLLVVSAATKRTAPAHARSLARELTGVLGDGVRLFPSEIGALGGTTNVQARALARIPSTTFLHLELSARLRERLSASAQLHDRFATAVLGRAATRAAGGR